jgi:hypothetical protein
MQTIKNLGYVAGLIFLCTALTFSGCNGSGNATPSDSVKTAGFDSTRIDSSQKTADSPKMAPVDSAGAPPSHVPKKDTTVAPRPLVRKT